MPAADRECGRGVLPLRRGRYRLNWLPVPAFTVAIIALYILSVDISYDPPLLMPSVNAVVFFGAAVLAAFLAARSFLAWGATSVLFLGGGMLMFGLACFSGSVFVSLGRQNTGVTTHNIGALVAGVFYLICALEVTVPRIAPELRQSRRLFLFVLYTSTLATLSGAAVLALHRALPVFYTSAGATHIRHVVLAVTVTEFMIAAALFAAMNHGRYTAFLRWYWVGLGLIGLGLVALSLARLGSALSWAGRASQSLGQIYILVSMFSVLRDSRTSRASLVWRIGASFFTLELEHLAVLDAAAEGISIANPNGTTIFANRQMGELLGRRVSDLLGQPILGQALTETAGESGDGLRRRLVQSEQRGLKIRIRHRDGSLRWVSINSSMVRDARDRLIGVVVMVSDITDRELAEEALRQSEYRFRRLVDSNIIGVLVADEKSITEANDVLLEMLGYRRDEFHGGRISWRGITPSEFAERDEQGLKELAERGSCAPFEKEFIRKDGSRVPILIGASLLARDPMTWIGFVLDLTKIKQAEAALRSFNEMLERQVAERTEKAQRLAGQLRALAAEMTRVEQAERRRLGSVLHDHIQQLLVAAKMQVALMKRDQGGASSKTASVRTAAKRMESLLDEAITASRSLALELSPPVLHSAGLGASLAWLADQMRDKYQLDVEVLTDARAEPADEEMRLMLYEFARELLFNVVKHSGVRKASVSTSITEDDRIRVEVEDKGEGFDATALAAEGSEKRGFGLFSIQQRIDYLGGCMEVESAPHKGTRIGLSVPARLGKPAAEDR